MSPSKTGHLLVYPVHAPGHIIPILDLTHLLLTRGLTITVLLSPADLPLLNPLLSAHPSSLHTLLLSPPDHPNYSSFHPVVATVLSTTHLFNPIVDWFRSHPSPPVAILSDFFLGWTNELASRLGIPRLAFWPMGALSSSVFHFIWRDIPEMGIVDPGDENFTVSFPEIPNSPNFHFWKVAHLSGLYKTGDPDWESFRNGLLGNSASWGIVFNSFERLESVYIDHVKKQTGQGRVWAVGPLLPNENDPIPNTGRGGPSAMPPHDVLKWLDKKPDDSVVYVCFGSRVILGRKQMGLLTAGLELSKVHFVLCVKGGDLSSIPPGFEEKILGRGFILKGWAPQLAILKHRAVGSFVTHCGWNSALEAVAAGVTMLTWPMGADQFSNAKLLVDELGVAARVCEGGPNSFPDSVELARLLDESLSDDWPGKMKAKELSEAASEAVGDGGSSRRDLDMLAKIIFEL